MKEKSTKIILGAAVLAIIIVALSLSSSGTGIFSAQGTYTIIVKTSPVGCNVIVTGVGSKVSDASGIASFSVTDGTYAITVGKEGYTSVSFSKTITQSKTFIVVLSALQLNKYTLTVNVNPTGSTISIPGQTGTTTSTGMTFSLVAGTYVATISKNGYVTQTPTITVAGDMTTTATLLPMTYTVTLSTTPASCIVTFETQTKISTTGTATFTGITAGTYAVQVAKTGYYTQTDSLTISADTTKSYTLQLITYELIIGTTPAGCTVILSGIGTKTSDGGYVTFENVPPGTYTLTASKTGYTTITRTITVGADETINIALAPGENPESPVPPIPQEKPADYMLLFVAIAVISLVAILVYLRRKK
jgi:hypothetical protein